jgi:hypothetical protein
LSRSRAGNKPSTKGDKGATNGAARPAQAAANATRERNGKKNTTRQSKKQRQRRAGETGHRKKQADTTTAGKTKPRGGQDTQDTPGAAADPNTDVVNLMEIEHGPIYSQSDIELRLKPLEILFHFISFQNKLTDFYLCLKCPGGGGTICDETSGKITA